MSNVSAVTLTGVDPQLTPPQMATEILHYAVEILLRDGDDIDPNLWALLAGLYWQLDKGDLDVDAEVLKDEVLTVMGGTDG